MFTNMYAHCTHTLQTQRQKNFKSSLILLSKHHPVSSREYSVFLWQTFQESTVEKVWRTEEMAWAKSLHQQILLCNQTHTTPIHLLSRTQGALRELTRKEVWFCLLIWDVGVASGTQQLPMCLSFHLAYNSQHKIFIWCSVLLLWNIKHQ